MHNPHLLSLCEANIEKIINNTENDTYTDYKIEHTKMTAKTNNSRNAISKKNDNIYTRRYDLENDTTSTIWLELKIPEGKNILISSIYRQWSLPKALGIRKSNNSHNQTLRWKSVISQWQKAHKENKEIIILTDDNMDHNNNTFNNNYKINNIKDMTIEFLNNNNYTTHNDENTD